MLKELRFQPPRLYFKTRQLGYTFGLLIFTFILSPHIQAENNMKAMTQQRMESIVKREAQSTEGGSGMMKFMYRGVAMLLISDVNADRMRIISPIVEQDQMTLEQLQASMISNFHLALDARYALSDNVLYSAYIHPLSNLREQQLLSALNQVANLALSFGVEYSSGELTFGGEPQQGPNTKREKQNIH